MSDSRTPIRIGVIGTGQIGKRHLEAYAKIPDAKVIAVADVNEAAAREAGTLHNVQNVYSDFHALLTRDDIDAVDVCLHNNLHAPVTIAAMKAGKHVFCEKPMAGSYRDAVSMLDAAKSTGRKLAIQIYDIFHKETRVAKAMIDQGQLGEVFHARSTGYRRRGRPFVDGYASPAFVQKKNSAGGALYDMGVYHISVMLHLLGNPRVQRVTGKTYQRTEMHAGRKASSGYDVEELGVGFVRFDNGASLDIIEAWAIHLDSLDGASIVGDKGGIRLNPFGYFTSNGDINIDSKIDAGAAVARWSNLDGEADAYAGPQPHWIAALQARVPLLPTAELALNTMLVSEGIYLSEKLGREVTAEEILTHSVSTAVAV